MYATLYPTSGIIPVEGGFLIAPFAAMIRSMEPILRGPGFAAAWARISEHAFRLDEVPADVRSFVEATSRPRQEVVLGYWQQLFERTPAELQAWVDAGSRDASAIRRAGHLGRRAGSVPRGGCLAGGEPARRSNPRLARQRSFPASGAPACLRRTPGDDGSSGSLGRGVDQLTPTLGEVAIKAATTRRRPWPGSWCSGPRHKRPEARPTGPMSARRARSGKSGERGRYLPRIARYGGR